MIIVYTPEGGAPERFDIRSLRTSEASIAQRTLGMTWAEIQKGIDVDDPEVLRGVAFVLKKRAEPSLRYSDFDPVIGELVTRLDKREVTQYIQNAFEIAATDDEFSAEAVAGACRRVVAVAEDPEHAEQVIAEMTEDPKEENGEETAEGAGSPLPKESASTSTTTSTSSEPSGSDSSPTSATSPAPSSTS